MLQCKKNEAKKNVSRNRKHFTKTSKRHKEKKDDEWKNKEEVEKKKK